MGVGFSFVTSGIIAFGESIWPPGSLKHLSGMVKSEAIARALVADPSKLDLKGENREMTVLFADVPDPSIGQESVDQMEETRRQMLSVLKTKRTSKIT